MSSGILSYYFTDKEQNNSIMNATSSASDEKPKRSKLERKQQRREHTQLCEGMLHTNSS